MEVRVGMAGYTGGIRAFEYTVLVTLLTGDTHMRARQREVGKVMIEVGILPFIRRVTATTVRAKLTVVFVVLLMAGVTIGGRTCEDIILMTTFAGDSRVPAFEFESRKVVIELRGLPTVGRMTGGAILPEPAVVFVILPMA